jgi:hypothetical protein
VIADANRRRHIDDDLWAIGHALALELVDRDDALEREARDRLGGRRC